MICKSCGTQGKGKFCAHCGEKLVPDAATAPSSPAPVSIKPGRKERRLPPLSLKMVFWQSIALFLPLAYLFFDTFIFLSESLFGYSASGDMYLHRFVERLADLSYETNTVGEIAELTIGGADTLYHALSPLSLISGGTMISVWVALPLLLIVLLSLLCAASGVLLLLTGGRILRLRAFCDLTLLFGVSATFSPLLASLLLRLRYCFDGGLAAADAQMQHIVLSLEALCVMGILACVLLPALVSLRRLAAYAKKERGFVCFPYRFLTKCPIIITKIMIVFCLIAFVALTVCFFCFPITTVAAEQNLNGVMKGIGGDFEAAIAAVKCLFAKGSGTSLLESAAILLKVAGHIWIVFVLLFALMAVFFLLGAFFIKKESLLKRKRKQRAVKKAATAIRKTVLAPLIVFVVVQTVLCITLLLFTPIAMHVDFSNVGDTLSVVYLTAANIRTLGTTNTLYALLAVCGLLLWHAADGAATALIVQADKQRSA